MLLGTWTRLEASPDPCLSDRSLFWTVLQLTLGYHIPQQQHIDLLEESNAAIGCGHMYLELADSALAKAI
jgi:hypothetical protein